MAQLDRFLTVMVANHADSITLVENDIATLHVVGVPRPITRKPLSGPQLLMLLREIAPEPMTGQLTEGAATAFRYVHADNTFAVTTARRDGKWMASIGLADAPDAIDAAG